MIKRPWWMELRRVFSAVVLGGAIGMLTLASCAPARAPVVDTDAMAKDLTKLDDDWSKSAATHNADSVAAFYAGDAIAYPPDAPAAVGREAAKKVWADSFADSTYRISWKTDHAGVAKSGDLGYTAGTFDESYVAHGKPISRKGKYTCVWSKQADGTWKALHDNWNYDSK